MRKGCRGSGTRDFEGWVRALGRFSLKRPSVKERPFLERFHGFCLQVALQFPDQLLGDAAVVAARLEETTGSKMFILGDTAYGRCEFELKDGGWGRPRAPGFVVFPLLHWLPIMAVFLLDDDDCSPDTSSSSFYNIIFFR